MGLDGVELVMEVEDRFGITIRDAEAQRVRTVGDLVSLVNARMTAAAAARCPSLGAFLQLRRGVRDFLGQPSLAVRPKSTVVSVIPATRRREYWNALSSASDSHLAPLRYPRPLRLVMVVVSLVLVGLGAATAWVHVAMLPLGLITPLGVILVLFVTTSSLRIEPPAQLATFADLTRWQVGLTMAAGPAASEAEVLKRVRDIVVDVLGVDREAVVPEARLVEDLNMD